MSRASNSNLPVFLGVGVLALLVGLTASLMSGCDGGSKGYDAYSQDVVIDNVLSYHSSVDQGKANPVSDGPGVVYIDFSDGLVNAFKGNQNNISMIQAITKKLVNEGMEWKQLVGGKMMPMPSTSAELRQLFGKVVDPKSYAGWYAPIDLALEEISTGEKEALLITDFELYKQDGNEALNDPYAEEAFRKWLRKGNMVTFYHSSFEEKGEQKRLFYAVFSVGAPDQNSLLTKVSETLEGSGLVFESYTLTANPFSATADYGGVTKCGLNPILLQNAVKDASGNLLLQNATTTGGNVDVVCLEYNSTLWNGAVPDFVEVGEFSKEKPFLDQLVLNAAQGRGLTVSEVGVDVRDVSADFLRHVMLPRVEAAKAKLVYMKDVNGLDIIDPINTPTDVWEFLDLDGNALQNFPGGSRAMVELVEIHEELMSNGMKDDPSAVPLHLLVHDNFNGTQMLDGTRVLAIDIVVSGMKANEAGLSGLEWMSPNSGKPNNALRASIENTLYAFQVPIRKGTDGKPMRDRAVLYTYYIVMQP